MAQAPSALSRPLRRGGRRPALQPAGERRLRHVLSHRCISSLVFVRLSSCVSRAVGLGARRWGLGASVAAVGSGAARGWAGRGAVVGAGVGVLRGGATGAASASIRASRRGRVGALGCGSAGRSAGRAGSTGRCGVHGSWGVAASAGCASSVTTCSGGHSLRSVRSGHVAHAARRARGPRVNTFLGELPLFTGWMDRMWDHSRGPCWSDSTRKGGKAGAFRCGIRRVPPNQVLHLTACLQRGRRCRPLAARTAAGERHVRHTRVGQPYV